MLAALELTLFMRTQRRTKLGRDRFAKPASGIQHKQYKFFGIHGLTTQQ